VTFCLTDCPQARTTLLDDLRYGFDKVTARLMAIEVCIKELYDLYERTGFYLHFDPLADHLKTLLKTII
jgi:hypothetical protein